MLILRPGVSGKSTLGARLNLVTGLSERPGLFMVIIEHIEVDLENAENRRATCMTPTFSNSGRLSAASGGLLALLAIAVFLNSSTAATCPSRHRS